MKKDLGICTLFDSFLEKFHYVRIPGGRVRVLHQRIKRHVFIPGGQVVERRHIGMRRAGSVLEAGSCPHGTVDAGCEILGVEIRQESVHLVIGHGAPVGLSHTRGPVNNAEMSA